MTKQEIKEEMSNNVDVTFEAIERLYGICEYYHLSKDNDVFVYNEMLNCLIDEYGGRGILFDVAERYLTEQDLEAEGCGPSYYHAIRYVFRLCEAYYNAGPFLKRDVDLFGKIKEVTQTFVCKII